MSTENEQPSSGEQQPIEAPKTYQNPFMQQVNEKPYSSMNVGVTQEQLNIPIPEPTFTPHTIDANENPYNMLNGDDGFKGGSSSTKSSQPFNPSMNDLPDGDKKMGAEHLANLILDGYESLHPFANKALQISPKKLQKLEKEGVIDLSIPIPFQAGQTISAGELVQEFNEQNKDVLTVSKQWKKEVKPVLTRVLEKRGAGLTDEQMLMYLFGKDIAVKTIIAFQVRSSINDLINVMKDATEAYRGGSYTPQEPTTPPPSQPTPRPTTQFQEPDHSAPDFNFQDNEVVMQSSVQQHNVPESGRERVKAQIAKEKQWQKAGAIKNQKEPSAYEKAMANRKGSKKNRKAKDYIEEVKMDEEQIAEAIVLNETINQPKKEKDPYADLD